MKQVIMISLILFYFIPVLGLPIEFNQHTGKKKWSAYQGKMSWEAAKAKCANLGLRLPLRKELEFAYKERITASWKEADFFSGYWFWSSEEHSEDFAYFLDIGYGDISYADKSSDDRHVRCIR